jgi:hypothetical protein
MFQTTTAAAYVVVRRHIGAVATLSLHDIGFDTKQGNNRVVQGCRSTAQQWEELR